MSEYRVTAPCVYAQGGRAVMHLHAGAFVELEDEVAATVADCVDLIDRSGAVEANEPAEITELAQHPVEEPAVEPEVVELAEPEVETEKGRRPRRGSDG